MRKHLLLVLLCTLFSLISAQAETITFNVSPGTGQCLKGGSTAGTTAGHYFNTWKSTKTAPQLSVTTSKNDMWIHTNTSSVHYFGGCRFTLTVTDGYIITGYSFDFLGYDGNSNSYTTRKEMTVQDAGGNEYKCATTATGRVEVKDLESSTTYFDVVGPVTGNGNVLVTNFEVYVETKPNTLQPFQPTQITDGAFADDTQWYTLEVKAFGRQAYRASDTSVELRNNDPLSEEDAYLWCFVGDREQGFKVYNKAAGPTKCYVVARSGLTNGSAPRFVTEAGMSETQYDARWYFTESTYDPSLVGYRPVYMSPSFNTTYALNDYQENGALKFWDGRGLGSTVTICPQGRVVPEDKARTVKVFDNANSSVPYRIPALAKTADGKLILVVDYRYSKADIGNGPIDLRYKISSDNGRTWSQEYTNLGDGDVSKASGNQWDYAFGDPSIVADCEDPNEVLVIAVGGHVGYFSSTYANPQHVVRFRSHDGGTTWTKGDSLTYQIYNLYQNSAKGNTVGIFLTSGKIMQSRYVKAGSHYRLYIAHPFRGDNGQCCFVIYSDDFGETWKVLGGNKTIASTGMDESKIEELPDGSVVISSRNQSGGRVVNVYTYTDSKTAEGAWSTTATPAPMASGKVNACNGEILVVPAKRNADGKQLYVALQSVPMSTSRQYVGFYYKELASAADFITGAKMAENWQSGLRVSQTTSCYSTMVMMDDNNIGFVYEENSYNGGYDIVFKALSLDTITGGAYTYDPSFTDRSAYFRSSLSERMPEVESGGTIVGQISDLGDFETAREAFEKNPTQESMESVWRLYSEGLPTIPLLTNRPYRLRNLKEYKTGDIRYMAMDASTTTTHTNSTLTTDELFVFLPGTTEGQYYIYCPQYQRYVGRTGANETKVAYVSSTALAGRYSVASDVSGRSTLVCNNPTGTNSALHCASDGRVVPWQAPTEASGWNIIPVTEWNVALSDCEHFSAAAVNMPFAYTLPEAVNAYRIPNINESGEANVEEISSPVFISSDTPVLLLSRDGEEQVTLTIPDQLEEVDVTEVATTNILKGALLRTTAENVGIFAFKNGRAGFYPDAKLANMTTIPANSAYLTDVPTAGVPLNYTMLNVGISSPSTDNGQWSMVFDLQGRRVQKTTKGVYIENGRKVLK
ncbi:MAG: exo-alpha-sialidase [Alloprevotella sp.]|nr:exo-alpha-sialidase [Alloprevotella sp.]